MKSEALEVMSKRTLAQRFFFDFPDASLLSHFTVGNSRHKSGRKVKDIYYKSSDVVSRDSFLILIAGQWFHKPLEFKEKKEFRHLIRCHPRDLDQGVDGLRIDV